MMEQLRDYKFEGYEDMLGHFVSYFYQISLIRQLNPKNVLEVGIGSRFVSTYLKLKGMNITTCDIDKRLKPDKQGDIRKLPFRNKLFDLVLVAEVLEHIPFDDLDMALSEIHRVTKKYAIITIPYQSLYFEIVLKSQLIEKVFNKNQIMGRMQIPMFFKEMEQGNEHYWEAGLKDYPLERIRMHFRKYFTIEREFTPEIATFHKFYVLRKKLEVETEK